MDPSEYEAFESSMNLGLDIAEEGLFSKIKDKIDARKQKKAMKWEEDKIEVAQIYDQLIQESFDLIRQKNVNEFPSTSKCFELIIKGWGENSNGKNYYFRTFRNDDEGMSLMVESEEEPGYGLTAEGTDYMDIVYVFYEDLIRDLRIRLSRNHELKTMKIRCVVKDSYKDGLYIKTI